ncbi:hypothetical protein AB0J63_48375 [Streptosporangium canum]|uniref:hypothetical protein n=1 Tax=Streptosporangium canum TaxID=324952 RepID=UPI0034224EEE
MRFHKALTIAATLALSSALTLTATTTPAHAAPTCAPGWSPDLHTAWIDCDNGFTTGRFRLKALFCSGTGCSWRYGPDKYYQGGGASSHTDAIWVDVNNITYEDRGPGSLAPAS